MARYLRKFGFGGRPMADLLKREAETLVHYTESLCDKPVEILPLVMRFTCNVTNTMFFCKEFDDTDTDYDRFLANLHDIAIFWGGTVHYLPFLRFLPGDLFGFKRTQRLLSEAREYCQRMVNERQRQLKRDTAGDPYDVIGLYMQDVERREQGDTTVDIISGMYAVPL